jgi:hypothetical protein
MRRVHVSLLLAAAVVCLTITAASTAAQSRAAHTPGDAADLTMVRWVKSLNADAKSGDFTSLQALFVPTAVFIKGTPDGSMRVQGPAAIAGFWQGWAKSNPGAVWNVLSKKEIGPGVYMDLVGVGRPGAAFGGRCAHIYVVNEAGLITREYDFVYWSKP